MSWQGRVRALTKAKGYKLKEVAHYVGVEPPTMTQWMKGIRGCKLEYRLKIAHFLDSTLDYIDHGIEGITKGHVPVISIHSPSEQELKALACYLGRAKKDTISTCLKAWIQATKQSSPNTPELASHQPLTTTTLINPEASDGTFAIPMNDDTMTDLSNSQGISFPCNAHVLIDPAISPKSGNCIVVSVEGQWLFRRWMPIGDNHLLTLLNPVYREQTQIKYEGPMESVFIGTAVGYSLTLN